MTEKEFDIIGHSLGINVYHSRMSKAKKDKKLPKKFYRTHYQAAKGHNIWENLLTLVESGLMEKREQFGMPVFHVTDKGISVFKNKWSSDILK